MKLSVAYSGVLECGEMESGGETCRPRLHLRSFILFEYAD